MNSSTPNNSPKPTRRYTSTHLFELVLFAMLGCLMFCSKIVMEALPNIHLLGMLTMTYTMVFRWKALIPLYIYVFLNGLYAGFNQWWIPYLYLWTILWGLTMLLPKKMPRAACVVVYPILCSLHGFLSGVLYSPAQALMFNYTLEEWTSWIIVGIPFDLLHGVGNLAAGLFIFPLTQLLTKLSKRAGII